MAQEPAPIKGCRSCTSSLFFGTVAEKRKGRARRVFAGETPALPLVGPAPDHIPCLRSADPSMNTNCFLYDIQCQVHGAFCIETQIEVARCKPRIYSPLPICRAQMPRWHGVGKRTPSAAWPRRPSR